MSSGTRSYSQSSISKAHWLLAVLLAALSLLCVLYKAPMQMPLHGQITAAAAALDLEPEALFEPQVDLDTDLVYLEEEPECDAYTVPSSLLADASDYHSDKELLYQGFEVAHTMNMVLRPHPVASLQEISESIELPPPIVG